MTDLAQMRQIHDYWVSRLAVVAGDVQIGAESSIWHFAVIRGDVAAVCMGPRTIVQDAAILHCQVDQPLQIEGEMIVGHQAVIHCRRIGRRSLIGIGSILLDGVQIGANCIVAAGSLVPPDTIVPDGKVVMGVPARVVRDVTPEEVANVEVAVAKYIDLARQHTEGGYRWMA